MPKKGFGKHECFFRGVPLGKAACLGLESGDPDIKFYDTQPLINFRSDFINRLTEEPLVPSPGKIVPPLGIQVPDKSKVICHIQIFQEYVICVIQVFDKSMLYATSMSLTRVCYMPHPSLSFSFFFTSNQSSSFQRFNNIDQSSTIYLYRERVLLELIRHKTTKTFFFFFGNES